MCWLKAVGESIHVCEVGIDIDVCFFILSTSNPSLLLIYPFVGVCVWILYTEGRSLSTSTCASTLRYKVNVVLRNVKICIKSLHSS